MRDGLFQSTHSLRSATSRWEPRKEEENVSIHALLAECDSAIEPGVTYKIGFNPRTPCGVRLYCSAMFRVPGKFQSTHSLRSATPCRLHKVRLSPSFNPRTPCGVRHDRLPEKVREKQFQSTHSLRSATSGKDGAHAIIGVSIHALLAECDSIKTLHPLLDTGFNPRTPCGVRLRPTLYIATQQSKSYFAPTSLKRPSLHGCSF